MTQEDQVSLDPAEIKQVLDALAASEWDEAVVTVGEVTISVARNGAHLGTVPAVTPPVAPASATAPTAAATEPAASPPLASPAPASPAAQTAEGTAVTAPSIGVFWRSPQPGAPPFVEVGSQVAAGAVLAIVEVMKLMNNITAPCAGTVAQICVENAAAVEHGDVLIVLTPDGG